MDLIEKATALATKAHEGQVRKTDGSPYIQHPLAVGAILKEAGFDDQVVAAGITHDVLEDTSVSKEEIQEQLGDEVLQMVIGVSEDMSMVWEERKEQYAIEVSQASEGTKAVSIADKIHNAQSLIEYHSAIGKDAWKVFNRGKDKKIWFEELVYEKVASAWSHTMLDQYKVLIEQLKKLPD